MMQTAIDFEAAREAGYAGARASAEHADAVSPGWTERAYQALCAFARQVRSFTSFDFRCSVESQGLEKPPTDKAYGAVFQRAARAGVIRKAGYAPHPERHCSPTPIWEAA